MAIDEHPHNLTKLFWLYSTVFILWGIYSIYNVVTNRVKTPYQVASSSTSIIFMALGVLFILKDLHFNYVWYPREKRYNQKVFNSALVEILEIINLLGYDNWIISKDYTDIRFENVKNETHLANFTMHTHNLTASYSKPDHPIWFHGWCHDTIKENVLEIIQGLSDHFDHPAEISDLKRIRKVNE